MPLLLVAEFKTANTFSMVEIPYKIREKYPFIFSAIDKGYKVEVRVYVSRVFNKDGNVVKEKEYKQLFVCPIEKKSYSYYIDLSYFHIKYSVPVGYYIELVIIGFLTKIGDGRAVETPVLPNEFVVEEELGVPNRVSELVEAGKEALERIGREVEVIGLLYTVGLGTIAADLAEALTRCYMSDYEGSIKFFRKVVEWLRNYVRTEGIPGMSVSRLDRLKRYLSSSYDLISNFGEHDRTYGFMKEAVLRKEITVTVCRYLASYLGRGAGIVG